MEVGRRMAWKRRGVAGRLDVLASLFRSANIPGFMCVGLIGLLLLLTARASDEQRRECQKGVMGESAASGWTRVAELARQ